MRQQELRDAMRQRLSQQRFYHSKCVEEQAVRLASLHNGDAQQAMIAGILHDCCKEEDKQVMLRMIANSAIISDIDFARQPQLMHGYAGSLYITEHFGIVDQDIINAVRYHTTGRAGMSLLEQIVYLADLTSADRDFPYVDELRQLAETDIDGAMLFCQRYIVGALAHSGRIICRDTMEAYNEYCRKCMERRPKEDI